MITYYLEKLYSLVNENLYLSCPVLSGNMRHHIEINPVLIGNSEEITLCVSAPFYDLNEFNKTGRIRYTGKTVNGKQDYAYAVNAFGAFGRGGKDVNWVHRAIYEAVCTVASEMNAEVINELDLR